MIKVNLVPAEVLIAEQKRRTVRQAVAGGVFLLMILVGVSFWHWNRLNMLEARLKENEAKVKRLQKIVEQVRQLEATAKAVRSRLNVIENLLAARFLYTVFMEDWLRSLSSGVWLNNMNTSGSGTELVVQITGNAQSQGDISEWLRTLEDDDRFSNMNLGAISRGGAQGAYTYSFSLKSSYKFVPPKDIR